MMADMFGFKDNKNIGNYPMTKIQFETCMKKVAQLSKEYNIPIKEDSILTHYEFGQTHPKTTSYGKIDIIFLPPYPHVLKKDVGNFIRNKIQWYRNRL